jgi:hypothetical protein
MAMLGDARNPHALSVRGVGQDGPGHVESGPSTLPQAARAWRAREPSVANGLS